MSVLTRVPVFHVASMARSGETVFLRSLSAHPRLRVVHNLGEQDTEASAQLFEYLKHYRKQRIWRLHPLLRPFGIKARDVLVLKQGVWEHRYPFQGLILSRNPVSIYASLRTYDAPEGGDADLDALWHHNTDRLARWMRDIDHDLVSELLQLPPVEQFCFFYNRRMGALSELSCPVVHYETFVANPRRALEVATQAAGVPFEEAMLNAHTAYEEGSRGHGKIELAAPVHRGSLYKFQNVVTHAEFDTILEKTEPVFRRLGYHIEWDRIDVENEG